MFWPVNLISAGVASVEGKACLGTICVMLALVLKSIS